MINFNEVFLFKDINKDSQTVINQIPKQFYQKHTTIYMADEVVKSLDVVLSGYISVRHLEADGRTMVVHKASVGDVISLNKLFSNDNHYAMMVTALTDVSLLSIPKQTVIDLAKADEQFMLKIFNAMSKKTETLVRKIKAQSLSTLEERLAQYLITLYQKQHNNVLILPDTKQAIALEVATARSSLVRVLMKMRNQQLISFNRKTITLHRAFFKQYDLT